MVKKAVIQVRDTMIRTLQENGIDYICITDIARQKNPVEPKDVVKNWMRVKNTLEYLGLWEKLNNLNFKGVEFDPPFERGGKQCFHDESVSLGGNNGCYWYYYEKWSGRRYVRPKGYCV